MLEEGTHAPDFRFTGPSGKIISLSDYRGRWVLLYFYPKDNTPGCTVEACMLRDYFSDFEKYNAVVIGVSADSDANHHRFATKHALPFLLLSDPKRVLIHTYAAGGIFPKRISYLINPKGFIQKTYPKVVPGKHALEVLKDIRIFSSHTRHQHSEKKTSLF